MFDPHQVLKEAMARLSETAKIEMVKKMVEDIATFLDHHGIIVPEISVVAGPVVVKFSARRLAPVETPNPTPPNFRNDEIAGVRGVVGG